MVNPKCNDVNNAFMTENHFKIVIFGLVVSFVNSSSVLKLGQ